MSDGFFVHLTDTHLTASTDEGWGALERFVQQVNAMSPPPAFVVNTGDIVFASMKIKSTAEEFFPVFERYHRIMEALSVPLYNALGNHDMTQCDDGIPGEATYGKDVFKKFCGPRYQSFDWGDTHVVILDEWRITRNEAGDGLLLTEDIDDAQLDWLKRDLSTCRPGQAVIVFLHHPVADYPVLFEKLRDALRDDLHYWEIAGCDHQNSSWRRDHWRTMTTASFCGAWWKGPCVDGAPAGYALMFRDPTETIKPYYRGMDEPLAVANPLPGRTVAEAVSVQVYNPETGQTFQYEEDLRSRNPGWCDLEIHAGDHRQTTRVFRKPTHSQPMAVNAEAKIEFEMVECADEVTVEWNGETLATFCSEKIGLCEIPLPPKTVRDWNTLHFTGDAVVRAPRLLLGKIPVEDPRIQHWESLRPDWFGEGKRIQWDTTLRRLKTPWVYPENTFFYPIPTDRIP